MISVHIYCKRNNVRPVLSASSVVRYCIFTVAVFLTAKLGAEFVSIFYTLAIPPVDAYYTIFAVPAAVIVPFAVEFFRKYLRPRVKIEKNEDEKE